MTDLTCEEGLNVLMTENKTLIDKIHSLLKEISHNNTYIINLEKKVIDLQFELNQSQLVNKIDYKKKYRKMLSVFNEVEEYKMFCLENQIDFLENNNFTKIVDYLEKEKERKENELLEFLKSDIEKKDILLENLNKILTKNEQNFVEKTEQMKCQINYLIGLLSTKSEEDKNKKLLEVIKVLTLKNNELIGKDENKELREELKKKDSLINLLSQSIKEAENFKKTNEDLKKLNEEFLKNARESEFNLKSVFIDLESKEKSIKLLEERIKFLSLENESLIFKNQSLQNIYNEFFEKERLLDQKENELIKKQIQMESFENKLKENKKYLKMKKLKNKKLKNEKSEFKEKFDKLIKENENLKEKLNELTNQKESLFDDFNLKFKEEIFNYQIELEKMCQENEKLKEILSEKDKAINDLINNSSDTTLEVLGKEKYLLKEEINKLNKKLEENKQKYEICQQKFNDLSNEVNQNNSDEIFFLKNKVEELKDVILEKEKLINELKEVSKENNVCELLEKIKKKDSYIQQLNERADRLKTALIKLKESKKAEGM
ncbi:hypothetical protein TUBRATIS_10100 [Tubulinosema ratisbonensis]|uniref:Uncharacterized protein n=1 Tax=Tubulinosema ratisbonensis TaxID=291195 RepID=A0A437AMV8_9MICR|nr:hypothetical protein TUBRATIS_10100 [Tubulinosema ratisbonensis]